MGNGNLVLSRYPNESIVIDGNITVTVLSVRGDRVRIGVSAPPEVKVFRSELIGAKPPEPTKATDQPLLDCPTGVKIFATEWCATWPVVIKGDCTLAYADGKGIVAKGIEITLEFEPGYWQPAESFATALRAHGFENVKVALVTGAA